MYELQKPRTVRPQQATNAFQRFQRGLTFGSLAFLVAALLGIAAMLIGYVTIASSLDSPRDLSNRAGAFQSVRIYDRAGNLLNEAFNTDAGKRISVGINQISPYLRQATIATEDANFYQHSGIDFFALARALYYAVTERGLVSGASTIPQQLVKMLYLTPEQSISRKVKEAVLSAEISRTYRKDEILALYLNEVNYGNLAYGAAAAAETYFNKEPLELSLAEAALLAGLPQAPAYYDPYTHPERAKGRQGVVLALMVEAEYISPEEADNAWREELVYTPVSYDLKAPHFTLYVRQELEAYLGSQELYQEGMSVYTTLDSRLQSEAERIVRDQVSRLEANAVTNGALVAMNPQTGEVLALVGSADFDDVDIDGQINMALAPRQPGSTIKPLVYLTTFRQEDRPLNERWTPGTLVADIVEQFPDGANPPYVPTDYDNKERGMVTVRTALANSLNIPAVHALQHAGIPAFLDTAQRLGITTLTRPDYGLSLSLGAGEIPLLEMTGAFAVLANGGQRMPPITIQKIVNGDGSIRCEMNSTEHDPCQSVSGVGDQVVSAVDAFLITDVLSDNAARAAVFGPNSLLQLGERPVAAKTGTTNDFRDVLTLGYTPQIVTGVWVGNSSNAEMRNISGVTGAAPIWNEFMRTALADQPIVNFTPPPGVRQYEVCADTGTQPSEACPQKAIHWFAEDRPPLPKEQDPYQRVKLDRLTGKLATEFTPADAIEEKVFKVYPDEYRDWAEAHGIPQPPRDASDVYTFEPQVVIREPVEGEIVGGIVTVVGSADVPAFASYELQYGISHEPGAFSAPFWGPVGSPVIDGVLGQWDTSSLAEGPHTLRLVARDQAGAERDVRVRLFVMQPTPSPTALEPTATWTIEASTVEAPPTLAPPTVVPPTPLPEPPTATPFVEAPTATPLPAEPTAIPAETPTETPLPTAAPVVEATPTWTLEAPTPEATAAAADAITTTAPITSSADLTGTDLVTAGAAVAPTTQ
jgi:1A family penicillin-binding protein